PARTLGWSPPCRRVQRRCGGGWILRRAPLAKYVYLDVGLAALWRSPLLLLQVWRGLASLGGIVGGLAYLFSGGSEQTAKSIWIPSMYGTYVIVPEHLTGDRPVRFLGVAAESESTTAEPVQ
ncbi:MAG: hypothetical protein HC794_05710, partial [Nitrospiraceae bacterium]|nr:hypothetical protein [Nitrospiraceae bacterium]